MLKTYIEFFYPGSFMSETAVNEVADRTPPSDIPKGAYGYRFFSRTETTLDGETLKGQPRDYSGMTYFGEVLTLEDVAKLPGDTRILQSNMRGNGWDRVVRTVRGNFQPLRPEDTVIGVSEEPPNDFQKRA